MISYDNYKNRIEKLAKTKRVLHKFRFLICGVLALLVGGSVGLMVAKGAYMSDMSLSAQTISFNQPYEVTPAKAFLASPREQKVEYSLAGSGGWTTEKPVKAGKYTARTVTKKVVGYSYSSPVEFEILPIDAEFTITGSSVVYGDVPRYSLTQLVSGHRVDDNSLQFDYADPAADVTEVNAVESSLKIVDGSGDDFTCCYNVKFNGKTLSVKQRSLTVKPVAEEFTYDGVSHKSENAVTDETITGLAKGDEISVVTSLYDASGSAVYGAVNAGGYFVRLEQVKIMHGATDVTSRYNLTRLTSTLTINRRKLVLTTHDAEKIYDGAPLASVKFFAENLVNGHVANPDLSSMPNPVNVGLYKNEFGVYVFDGTTDVSSNYYIECDAGTLTITPRAITVATANDNKIYDGTPIENYGFTTSETLTKFLFNANENVRQNTIDAGEYQNEFEITATLNGSDVTENFAINYVYGKLTVYKRSLTVTTGSGEKVYDGTALTCNEPSGDNVARYQYLKQIKQFGVTNVTQAGGVANAAEYTVVDDLGRDVGINYTIKHVYGTLTVTALKISVTTVSDSRVYDGTAFSNGNYTATRVNAYGEGLYGGDRLTLTNFTAITNAGTVDNACSYSLPTFDGVHSNYEISGTINYGKLTVQPKQVTVFIKDAYAVYGEDIPLTQFNLDCGELPNGEAIIFDTHIEKFGATVTPEKWENYTLLNATAYSLVATAGTERITGGNALLSNYIFNFENGMLEIAARKIVVTTATASHVYDGNDFSDTTYTTVFADDITKKGLLKDDSLTVNSYMTVKTIDDIPTPNVVTYSVPNGNYTIFETKYGTLTIIPRPVIVETGSAVKTYDGNPLLCEDYSVSFAVQNEETKLWTADESKVGLIAGDSLTLVGEPVTLTDAGEKENANIYENGNYNIVGYKNGTLKVDKKRVEIKIEIKTAEYGNEGAYSYLYGQNTGFWRQDGSVENALAGSETLLIEVGFKKDGKILYMDYFVDSQPCWRLAVGSYEIYAVKYYVKSQPENGYTIDSGETLKNYEIYCEEGTLDITPRNVTVEINDGTAVYGDDVSEKDYGFVLDCTLNGVIDAPVETKLPYNEQLALTYKYDREVINVGDYDVLQNKVFIDGTEINLDSCNYAFTFINGTLNVTPFVIAMYIADKECEYGEKLPDVEWWFVDEDGNKIEKFPYGDTIEAINFYYCDRLTDDFCGWHIDNPHLNAGEYYTQADSVMINGSVSALDNYTASRVYHGGVLTVTAAPLKITLPEITGISYGDSWTYPQDKTIISGLKYEETVDVAVKYTDKYGNAIASPKNAGTYQIVVDEENCVVTNKDLSAGLLSNYKITFEAGSLIIARRALTVTFTEEYQDKIWFDIYYGDELPEPQYIIYEKGKEDVEYSFPYNEKVTFEYGYINLYTDEYETPKNVGTYELRITGVYVDGVLLTNATSNYTFSIKYAPGLIIQTRAVKLIISDFTKVYGSEISNWFAVNENQDGSKFYYGEKIEIKVNYLQNGVAVNPVNVGTYDLEAVEYFVYDEQGVLIENGADNYDFSSDFGRLTITPRPLTVTINDYNLTYGEKVTCPKPLFANIEGGIIGDGVYGLPYGDNLSASFLYNGKSPDIIKDAGYYEITVQNWDVVTGNKNKNNYDITWISGKLTIKPKKLNLVIDGGAGCLYGDKLAENSFRIYDENGDEYAVTDGEISAVLKRYALSDPEKTEIIPKNAGEYGVTVKSATLNGADIAIGESNYVSGNFILEITDGKLTVKPKTVQIVLSEIAPVLYGETFTYAAGAGNYASASSLAYGEKLEVAVEYFIDGEAGTPKNANYSSYNDRYIYDYSASLNINRSKIYESDGVTEIENGTDNYIFICEDAENLKISRRLIYLYVLDLQGVQYGEFGVTVSYPDEIGNYKRVEYADGESKVEGVPYGEQFKIAVEYLKDGKPAEPKNVGEYAIKWFNSTVYDAEGNEIKSGMQNYSFATAATWQGKLTIVPKDVKIALNSYEMQYGEFKIGEYGTFAYPDGKNNYNLYKSTPLAFNEQLKVDIKYQLSADGELVDTTPKSVGDYVIAGAGFTVYDGDGIASKDNYRISYEAGELTITQRQLKVEISRLLNCTYGEQVPQPESKLTSGGAQISVLPYGDTFNADFIYYVSGDDGKTAVTPKNAGVYGITVVNVYINGGKILLESLTGNYFITVSDGELNIAKADIDITLNSLPDVYYGIAPVYAAGKNNYDVINSASLVNGEVLEVAVIIENDGAWNCGDYIISLDEENSVVYTLDGVTPLSTNYNVTDVQVGYVTVAPRNVRVTFIDRQFEYGSGTAGNEEFDLSVDVSDVSDGSFSEGELPYGEILTFENAYVKNGLNVKPHNAGEYGIRHGIVKIDGDEDGARNYSFTYDYATLTINKKTVEITLDDITAQYGEYCVANPDGTFETVLPEIDSAHQTDGSENELLANGETLIVDIAFTAVGQENTNGYITPVNVGEYSVVAIQFTVISYEDGVYEGGQESAAGNKLTNYIITCGHGTLEISKRRLHIAFSDEVSYTYGEKLPEIPYFVTSDGVEYDTLPYGDNLAVSHHFEDANGNSCSPVNAGEYTVVYDGAAIDLNTVHPNYEITGENGLLTVFRKYINVTVYGGASVYGEKLPALNFDITSNGASYTLPNNEKLVPAFIFGLDGVWSSAPRNAGLYQIGVDENNCEIVGGNRRYSNYNVNYIFEGNLHIKAMPVTVTLGSGECVYGEELPEIAYTVTSGGEICSVLPYGDILKLNLIYVNKATGDKTAQPEAAGTYAITATAEIQGGNGRIENYAVTVADNSPELVILQREIEIVLNASGRVSFAYGEDYNSQLCAADVTGVLGGQQINIALSYAVKLEQTAKLLARFRALTAGGSGKFIPENVGNYIASLDLQNCTVTDADGNPTEGGIGNYKLRAGFNCAPVEFSIVPMQLTVTVHDAECEYGEKLPEITFGVAETMPEGQQLQLTFSLAGENGKPPVHKGEYAVNIAEASIDGGDVANYSIKYTNAAPKLTIKAKPVTVYVKNLLVPFGTEVDYAQAFGNYDADKSDALVEGDELKITEVSYTDAYGNAVEKPVNAGKYNIIFVSFEIVNAEGESATGDYDVTRKDGVLEIKGNVIVITTGSAEKEYDGSPLTCEDYSYSGTLAEGYKIVAEQLSEVVYVTSAGGVDNKTTFKVVDENGAPTDNYVVSYGVTYGKLKVTQRRIEIVTGTKSKEYDGAELTAGYTLKYAGAVTGSDAIADTDTFTVTETAGLTDAGSRPNILKYTITDGDGNDVSSNYRITEKFGLLSVSKKGVYVTIQNNSSVFGEQPAVLFKTDVPLVSGETLSFGVEYKQGGLTVKPVTDGEFFILPVGTYGIIYANKSSAIEGGRGKAENYVFDFNIDAELKVTPRHIVITTATDADEYDGEDFYNYKDYTTEWIKDGEKQGASGLINGDELTVLTYTKRMEIGSEDNICTYAAPENYVIEDNGYVYGTLTVTKRAITVKTADITETYDGAPHSNGTLSYNPLRLVEGHEILADGVIISQTDYTSGVKNKFTVKICDADGFDVSENYNISYNYGTIIINKRPLAITTGGVSSVYSGQPQGNDTPDSIGEGLLTGLGHELKLVKKFTYTNATEGVNNTAKYGVVLGATDLTHNYSITYTYGKIVIARAPVTVTLNEGVQVEYGDGSYVQKLTQGAVTLVNGETAEIAIFTDRAVGGIGVYTASVNWEDSIIKNNRGLVIADGADNYAPEFVPASCEFKVVKRNISVTLNAGGKSAFVYGEDYDGAIRNVKTSWSTDGEQLKVAVTYNLLKPKDVGEYTAAINLGACTVEGGDIANYNIVSCEDVSFEIVAKDLTVYMNDLTVGYGDALTYPDGDKGYYRAEGLLSGETLTVIPAFEKDGEAVLPEFAGEYDIVCGQITVYEGNTAVNTANYNVITGTPYGKLTIEGVNISVVRKTVTKVYDGQKLALSPDAPSEEVEYIIDGNLSATLPEGYKLVLVGEFATADGNVSSSMENTAEYAVVDGRGEAAGNYVITYAKNDAKLIILKRTVNVATDSATRRYNGSALTAGFTYDADELVAGHTLSVVSQASVTDAESKPNSMALTVTEGDKNVTVNYEIIVTEGTLTVEALPVNVEIADMQKVYGEDVNVNNFVLESKLVNGEVLNFRVLYAADGNTFDGSTPLNAGTYVIIADVDNMMVNGGRRLLTNYNFTFSEDATLTISRRHIVITTATDADEYDGEDFYNYKDYTTEWIKDGEKQGAAGLINGDELTVLTYTKRMEIGSEDNICTYAAPENYVIEDNGYVYGTLTVERRVISVTTADLTETYDGKMHSDGGFTYDESKLLNGHEISVDGKLTYQLDATEGVQNVFAVKITADGVDQTSNYDVQYTYGTIVIEKRALTVVLNKDGSVSFGYGDDTFDREFKNAVSTGLINGETLTVELLYDTDDGAAPVNAGTYTAEFDFENSFIAYAGEGNGISNYEINCVAVEFEITRREITVSLGSWSAEEYDGEEHVYDGAKCSVTGGSLVAGERLSEIAVKYFSDAAGQMQVEAAVNAGAYYVFLDLSLTTISGANGETAIEVNYDVSCDYVTFTITPKKLTVTLSDVTYVYDGEEYVFDEEAGFTSNICDGDIIECNVGYSATPVNAGSYTVTFQTPVVFVVGEAGNYVFDGAASKLTCTLEIKRRSISVTVETRDAETGGEEYTKEHLISQTAEGGEGFVGGDLENALVNFIYTDILPKPDFAVAYKNVSVTFGGDVMNNYDVTKITDGTLTVTERKVEVTPVFNGGIPYVYDGQPVDISLFGYSHLHNVENCPDNDRYGFTDAHAAGFAAVYTFTDENGNKLSAPVNAGTYTVSVTLSGADTDKYYITYQTAQFTIEKRALEYTLQVQGAGEYEYSNSRPAFTASLSGYDGFANGLPDGIGYELLDENGAAVSRYNVGVYTVGIVFEGMENYVITAHTAKVAIVPRVLVVGPSDPYGGVPQTYNGKNLTLGANDFVMHGGSTAEGDSLAVTGTQLAPTVKSGYLQIASVSINDSASGENVAANYTVYYTYNANNSVITGLGLRAADFRIRAEYSQTEIHYTLSGAGKSFPYTGEKFTYTLPDGNAATLSSGYLLNYGHKLSLSKNSVTVPAAAGVYGDLITKLVRVYDENGKDVTAVYTLVCDNPEAGEISVTENVLSIDLSGLSADTLETGVLNCVVSGLYAGASPEHKAEVYAYSLDGEWLIGITVFSESSTGRRTDLSANYKLSESAQLSGARVELITLAQAEEYLRPALGVEITVSQSDLNNGRGTLFTFDGESRWVLSESCYTVSGALQSGHKLQVLVLTENGVYVLGITVFSEENGRRSDVRNSYRLRDIKTTGVSAEYVAQSDIVNLQRELYIDLSGAFNADGTPKIENGFVTGYVAQGLNAADEHILEITATDNGDGTYTLTAVIYQLRRQGASYKKFNKGAVYSIVYTAPDGVTLIKGTVS